MFMSLYNVCVKYSYMRMYGTYIQYIALHYVALRSITLHYITHTLQYSITYTTLHCIHILLLSLHT